MDISYKCLPIGALPYLDLSLATRMLLRLFEKTPYLPFFPNIDKNDNVIYRTLDKLPGIVINDDEILLDIHTDSYTTGVKLMDDLYNNPDFEALKRYDFTSPYMDKYFQIIERLKPAQTVIHLLGPFTFSQVVNAEIDGTMLSDKLLRKYIIQALTLKVLWIVSNIYQISPDTRPIILFEEPKLNEFGVLKRENESITREVLFSVYARLFQNIHATDAAVGVQSFQKCDWQIPIDAGVDIISFDAYNNSSSLTIIPDKISAFLSEGGIINWAIVPVVTEAMVKSLNIEYLYDRFMKTTQELAESGVDKKLIYKNATVSLQGDISELPLVFAEKALILSSQLAGKIPKVS